MTDGREGLGGVWGFFCVMGAMFVLSLKADAGIKKYIKMQGEGDAEAYEKDLEFYSFVRTLEAYGNSLGESTTIVLPGDSEFFKYLSPPTKE